MFICEKIIVRNYTAAYRNCSKKRNGNPSFVNLNVTTKKIQVPLFETHLQQYNLLNLTLQELGTLKRGRVISGRICIQHYVGVEATSPVDAGYSIASGDQGFVNFASDTRTRVTA